MPSLFTGLLFGLTVVLVVGGIVFLLYWVVFVELPRKRAFEELLAKEGFTKVPQPKAINTEPFLASPIHAPREWVYKAWEKESSLGRIRVLYLQSRSAESTSTKVLLEVKVIPAADDFLVIPGPIPKWMAKIMAMVGHVKRMELPSDLAYRYEIFAAERTDVFVSPPFELPPGLLEYLKDQVGLRFSVASSSLLVERRVLAGDRMVQYDICDPESFATAMSDLTALVPLVSVK